jgi:hypothetical protein
VKPRASSCGRVGGSSIGWTRTSFDHLDLPFDPSIVRTFPSQSQRTVAFARLSAMERSLPGMFFLVAAVAISIAAGAWWMQRIVFTPDATRATAAAILEEPDIRLDINSLVSAASGPFLERSISEISTEVETQVLTTRAGALMMAPIIEQLHERIIGLRDDPVEITGLQMIDIVRDQRAADAARSRCRSNRSARCRTCAACSAGSC